MTDSIRITYLDHSGFMLETLKHMLLFDYYRDPAKAAHTIPGKPLYIFSSHAHGDHFNPAIGDWQHLAAAYILSSDIATSGGLPAVRQENTYYMSAYEEIKLNDVRVSSFGSTDQGVSFLVEADGWRIFHAGDLNWWHWHEDTAENIEQAKQDFFRELNHLRGHQFDLAFFPVDSRLENFRDLGIREFSKAVQIKHLVAMHACGQTWKPIEFAGYSESLWCPDRPGEIRDITK